MSTLTDLANALELSARWLRSDDARIALLHVAAPTPSGAAPSRSGQVSRPTEVAVMRHLDSGDPVERDQLRALQLIASIPKQSGELIEILVRLGTVAREDAAGDPCRANGCQGRANARRGLCWKHYREELAR